MLFRPRRPAVPGLCRVSSIRSQTSASLRNVRSIDLFDPNANHILHLTDLAPGVVILISIATAAGIVFLLVLFGILWTLFSRRDEVLSKFDPDTGDDDDSTKHRPSSLLEHINAATRTTILGSPSPFHNVSASGEKEAAAAADAGASSTGHDLLSGPDASNYVRAETPSDAFGGGLIGEETGRPAHARYSFDGAGEGELSLAVGQELEILDDRDHS